jgi:hypothetical protein
LAKSYVAAPRHARANRTLLKMKPAISILQNAIRILGVVLIVLGFLFWTGHALELVRFHMSLGFALVVLLWILAGIGTRAGLQPWVLISASLWGLLVIVFGMTMGTLLPGRSHELIRVLHFLIGLGAIALSESVAARIKRRTQVKQP